MSRIGKQPIAIPPKVKVEVKGQKVFVEGPKGKLDWELPRRTGLKVRDDKIIVSRDGEDAQAKALHGLSRALINNMVKGVTEGFVKKLEIQGVGFKAGELTGHFGGDIGNEKPGQLQMWIWLVLAKLPAQGGRLRGPLCIGE